MRSACDQQRWGWLVLLLVGCNGMLPPPPPPKMRTAPAVTPAPPPSREDPSAHDHASGPGHYKVRFETSKGEFVLQVHREWAPLAADRFRQLVEEGFYDGCKFFRIAKSPRIVQFGMNGDPNTNAKYQNNGIQDEPRKKSNLRGTIAFAKANAPNSRTSQLFINTGDNSDSLDPQGFAPFATVIKGLDDVVDKFTDEYGEEPNQGQIATIGNVYLDERFPNLDYIIKATVVDSIPAAPKKSDEPASQPAPEEPAKQPEPEKSAPDSEPKKDE